MKIIRARQISMSTVLFLSFFFWIPSTGFADDQASVSIDSPARHEAVKSDFDIKAHVSSGQNVKKVTVSLYDEKNQVISSATMETTIQEAEKKVVIEITSPKTDEVISGDIVHIVAKATPDEFKYFDDLYINAGKLKKGFRQGEAYEVDWDTSKETVDSMVTISAGALNSMGFPLGTPATKQVKIKSAQDKIPPEIEITSPADGDTIKGMVHVQLNATDDSGIKMIEIALPDGESAMPLLNKLPYAWDWDSTQVKDGNYTITAKVTDKAGNERSAKIKVTVKNQKEQDATTTVEIVSPKDGDTVKGSVPVQVNATNAAGIETIEIHLPDGENAYPMKNKLPYAWNWDSKSVSDGSYKIKSIACDKANHCGSSEIGVSVKNAP